MAEQSGAPALSGAAKTFDLSCGPPFLAHACMKVMNSTAAVTAARCEISRRQRLGQADKYATVFAATLTSHDKGLRLKPRPSRIFACAFRE